MERIEQPEGFAPMPGPKKRRASAAPSATALKARERSAAHIQTVGKVLPSAPMTADELAAAWELGQDDAFTLRVKIFQAQPGVKELSLVADVPLPDFSGEDLARNFGPGMYYLRPAAGRWAMKSAKLPISDGMARNLGWGSLRPQAADVLAHRTLEAATRGPVDPVDLMAAMERMFDQKLAALGMKPAAVPMVGQIMQPAAPDPTAAMEKEMERMAKMMDLMNGLQEKARETVRAELGVRTPEATEGNDMSIWLKLAEIAAPVAAAIFQARNAAPVTHQPPAAPSTPLPALPGPVPPTAAPAAPVSAVPMLTPQEQASIGQVVGMLKGYGPILVNMGKGPESDEQIAANLAPWIPPASYGQVVALSDLVDTKGPEVMNIIHPELGNDRWARILRALVAELTTEDEPGE